MNGQLMFFLLIRIYPSYGKEHTVIDILDSLKGPISSNNDCMDCTISVDTDQTRAICYSEQWRTREAMDQHLRSAYFNRVLEAMECSCQWPDVAFYVASKVGELELVEQLRKL